MAIEVTTMTDEQRAALQAAIGGSETVTTGVAPISANLNVSVTKIISGGTAGDESLTLALPTLPVDSYVNADFVGLRHTFVVVTQADPADRVILTAPGSFLAIVDNFGNTLANPSLGKIVLDYVGAHVVLVWGGESWLVETLSQETDTSWINEVAYLPPVSNLNQQILISNNGAWQTFPDSGVASSYEYLTSGVVPVAASTQYHQAFMETGNSGGTETITFARPDDGGLGPALVGMRHLFILGEQNNPSDVISLDVTNIQDASGAALASITFDTVNQYLLVEAWDIATWRVVRGTATVSLI